MNRLIAVAGLALLTACGSSGDAQNSPSIASPLVGDWIFEQGTTGVGMALSADDTYVFSVLQVVNTNSLNAQVEKGQYAAAAGKLTLTPNQSTCPGPHPPYVETYTV